MHKSKFHIQNLNKKHLGSISSVKIQAKQYTKITYADSLSKFFVSYLRSTIIKKHGAFN